MPTFTEHAGASRDSRSLAARAPPLVPLPHPRDERGREEVSGQANGQVNGLEEGKGKEERYDVVVVGAGPSGLFLNLLLHRFGLPPSSILCVDAKPSTTRTGQADGLQPRTLEVLQTLGLAHEILDEGCHMWEVGFWNAKGPDRIERTSYAADVVVRARFMHEVTLHQGRIERILAEDLAKYRDHARHGPGVVHSTRYHEFSMEDDIDAEYPLAVKIGPVSSEHESTQPQSRTVRAKHIIAADGAHSLVRRHAGLLLEGESRDHVWGVVDFVADTDFPDVRRRCAIHSEAGSAMVIPRERIADGGYLTRLYIQMDDVVVEEDGNVRENSNGGGEAPAKEEGLGHVHSAEAQERERRKASAKRQKVSLQTIFRQAERVFRPYYLRMAEGTEPDWWAAYQIGQRMTSAFTMEDSGGVPRVFVMGDAAHTHSPKAGQGMNVSLMDSYNLSWKLAYHLLKICPSTAPSSAAPPPSPAMTQNGSDNVSPSVALLQTYATERSAVARDLIDFDTRFSTMFSGKLGATLALDGQPLTHERFLEVFSQGSGFSSGCGIEYAPSELVVPVDMERLEWHEGPRSGQELQQALLNGGLWPGRRLADLRVIRHADGIPMHLHDAFPSTGRFRILVLASTALLSPTSCSWQTITAAANLVQNTQPSKILELVVLHPLKLSETRGLNWSTSLPPGLKRVAEMRFFCGREGEYTFGHDGPGRKEEWCPEDVYKTYGVHCEVGCVAVVRPDGYVGCIFGLEKEWEGLAGKGKVEKEWVDPMVGVRRYLGRFLSLS